MREIDFVLNSCWRLGKTIVAGWSHQGAKISFCFSESYNVLGKAEAMPRLIRGKRLMGPRTFADACKTLRARTMAMEVPFTVGSPEERRVWKEGVRTRRSRGEPEQTKTK